jgi:hypothetical protein
MRLNIVSMKLYKLSNAQLLVLANAVVASANGNLSYPTPNPTLLVLGGLITAFSDALTAWGPPGNRGSRAQHSAVISTRNDLRAALTALALYAENTTPGDRNALGTIDWPLRPINTPTGILQAVENLRQMIQRDIVQGTLKLRWNKPLNAVNIRINGYRVMRGLTADFNAATQIAITSKTSYIDENPGDGYKFYWIIPFNAYGDGVKSNVCPAIATQMV